MKKKPWICPACGRGVTSSEKTCDHGGGMILVPIPVIVPIYPTPVELPVLEPTLSMPGTNLQ